MNFSERHGYKPVRDVVQRESMDDALRTSLWNVLEVFYWKQRRGKRRTTASDTRGYRIIDTAPRIWAQHFKYPIDTIPPFWDQTIARIRDYFFSCSWNEVLDFLEFMDGLMGESKFADSCNGVLEREVSAYRFMGGKITEITSGAEIQEIEEALAQNQDVLAGARTHLAAALNLLADRKDPDYRNSIKESISAVEALARGLTGERTLGAALKKLNDKVDIHPALESAFSKLYGYTSDADGIRHALMDEPALSFEDAKFMLVSCSAFVNYLAVKAGEAGGPPA